MLTVGISRCWHYGGGVLFSFSWFCLGSGHKSQSINRGKKKNTMFSSFSTNKPKLYFKPSIELGGRNLFIVFLDLWLSSRDIQQAKAVDSGDQLALCHHLTVLAEGWLSFPVWLPGVSSHSSWLCFLAARPPLGCSCTTQSTRNLIRLCKSQMSM